MAIDPVEIAALAAAAFAAWSSARRKAMTCLTTSSLASKVALAGLASVATNDSVSTALSSELTALATSSRLNPDLAVSGSSHSCSVVSRPLADG